MALQKSSQLIATSGSFLETVEKVHRGVDGDVGKSLQELASLESAVKLARAAIKELNAHASDEQILTFTSQGGNDGRRSTIFQPSKRGKRYEPITTFTTFAKSFPFLGDKIVRASDHSTILINSDLRIGLSLDGAFASGIGFFPEATVVGRDFISSEVIQEGFKKALWHIEKMTGEDPLPNGYEFDYGYY